MTALPVPVRYSSESCHLEEVRSLNGFHLMPRTWELAKQKKRRPFGHRKVVCALEERRNSEADQTALLACNEAIFSVE